MGNGKVETVLSNDGKTRLKGKVGSQSTLVKQAKAPATDITKVNIDKVNVDKKVLDTEHPALVKARKDEEKAKVAVEIALNGLMDAEVANPALVKARAKWGKLVEAVEASKRGSKAYEYNLSKAKAAFAVVDKIENEDSNIHKADDDLFAAKETLERLTNSRLRLEEIIKENGLSVSHWEVLTSVADIINEQNGTPGYPIFPDSDLIEDLDLDRIAMSYIFDDIKYKYGIDIEAIGCKLETVGDLVNCIVPSE